MSEGGHLNYAGKLATGHREVTSWDPLTMRPTTEDFLKELQSWHKKETGESLRAPVFSRKELDLAQLWSVVQELGGSEKVCLEKRWAGIGRLFDPPKNMTNLSFHIKRLYEKHLLPFERARFPERAMTEDNEQINACRKRIPGDDFYEFDPIRMEPIPVSGCASARDPHSSDIHANHASMDTSRAERFVYNSSSPSSTPTAFQPKGIAFKSSLLEWNVNGNICTPSVTSGEVIRVIRSDPVAQARIQTPLDGSTISWTKCDAQHKTTCDTQAEHKEWEYATISQIESLKRLKNMRDINSGMQGNTSEHPGRKVHIVDSTLQELAIPSFGPAVAIRQYGLKPMLASDCIADADQAIKANLQPLNVPGKPVLSKKTISVDAYGEGAFQKVLDRIRASHAKEVEKLQREIQEYQKQIVEVETAQKVAEAVAEESRRCFQQLLQTAGISRVLSTGTGHRVSSHVKESKRGLDRAESDLPTKRQKQLHRGLLIHRGRD